MRISSQLNELRKQAASRRTQNSRGSTPHPSPAVSEVASEADSEIHSRAGSRLSRRSHLLDVATAKSEISANTAMSDLDEILQADIKSEKHSTHGSENGDRNDNLKDNLAGYEPNISGSVENPQDRTRNRTKSQNEFLGSFTSPQKQPHSDQRGGGSGRARDCELHTRRVHRLRTSSASPPQ